MKVVVNWGAKNTSAKYEVVARDLEGSLQFLMQRGDEWGSFLGDFQYRWSADGAGRVQTVTLSPTYTITMPNWRGYRRIAQECQNEWDTMWRALERHEDGHRAIFDQGITTLVSDLNALTSATGSQIDARMQQARSDIQDAHDAYDTRTDHGKSQGVELFIPEKCKRNP